MYSITMKLKVLTHGGAIVRLRGDAQVDYECIAIVCICIQCIQYQRGFKTRA